MDERIKTLQKVQLEFTRSDHGREKILLETRRVSAAPRLESIPKSRTNK
jgi:hypothetical protein